MHRNNGRIGPHLSSRTEDQQITGVLAYNLFVKARQRYIDLGYDVNRLFLFAQTPVLYIDIDQTIKQIKEY